MKRDDTDKQDGLAAETVEEAKKLADLYTARAHKAKLRLKQTRKTYKEPGRRRKSSQTGEDAQGARTQSQTQNSSQNRAKKG